MKQATLIKVDGTETVVEFHGMRDLLRHVDWDCADTVNLRDGRVMMVDDTGMIDGKPINPKATALYHGVCRPDTPYSIHGDVLVAWDQDFA